MTQTENELEEVMAQLSLLTPEADELPRPAPQALARLNKQIAAKPTNRIHNWIRSLREMSNRKPLAVGLSLILLVAILFSFPAVRTAASDFLGLFRVQKFAPISVSPEQIALLERIAEEGLSPGKLEVLREPGALTAVDSLGEAGANTGLTVRTLPDLGTPNEIYVVDGGNGRLEIDLAGARAIVEAAGADPALLPDSLDGARVFVAVFPGVQQIWDGETVFMQTESPLVEYPEDVDETVLGEALLQVLGTEPEEARRIAQNIDWAGTLLLPIPQDTVTFQEVNINGVSGVFLGTLDGGNNAVMWQEDGIIYMLHSPNDMETLLSLAKSVR